MIYVNTAGENVCDGNCDNCEDKSCPDYFKSNAVRCSECEHCKTEYYPQTYWEPDEFYWECKLDLETNEWFEDLFLCPKYERKHEPKYSAKE